MSFYLLVAGREPGIYRSYEDCEKAINGFVAPQIIKFSSYVDASRTYKGQKTEDSTPHIRKIMSEINYTLKRSESAIFYVDGTYNDNNKTYGAGVLMIDKGGMNQYCIKGRTVFDEEYRNLVGEMGAIIFAIEIAETHRKKEVIINTDFKTAIDIFNDKQAPKSDFLKFLKNYLDKCDGKFKYLKLLKVKSHKGEIGHNIADKLAKFSRKMEECGYLKI